jgi:hypothetical protein
MMRNKEATKSFRISFKVNGITSDWRKFPTTLQCKSRAFFPPPQHMTFPLFLRRALSSRLSSLCDSFQFGQARVRNVNNATRQLHQVCTGAAFYGLISTAAVPHFLCCSNKESNWRLFARATQFYGKINFLECFILTHLQDVPRVKFVNNGRRRCNFCRPQIARACSSRE